MGKALVYGDNINTDLVIAGKYTKTLNFDDLAKHCMEDLDPEFPNKVEPGDVLVAGANFGCGSSREQAPLALKYSGIRYVLAKSFARIFYRNSINIGVPALICDTSDIRDGEEIEVDMSRGVVIVGGEREIFCQALSPVVQNILSAGGLASYLREKGDFILE